MRLPVDPSTCLNGQTPARRVLLVVTGLTPQVVTETLFALAQESPDALPNELHVLTTTEGAERAKLALLSEQPGWFHRLRLDHGLPPIDFGLQHIHVLCGADGKPLSDIRTAQDNACAADQVAELIRRFTLDARTQLHVSLAGGRKTLGFFAGYALSLWGRDSDRLSHVLVSEPFESSWDFFYPTPYERIIETRGGKLANCMHAEVTLADLPFVRLRHGLAQSQLSDRADFAKAVQTAQAQLGPARLRIDLQRQEVHAAGRPVTLAPAELAFFAWFARRASLSLPGLPCPPDGAPCMELAQAYLSEYRRVRGFMGDDGRSEARYRKGMTKADFEERKSKLKRALSSALGTSVAPYLIVGVGRRPMRYHLALAADAIEFVMP